MDMNFSEIFVFVIFDPDIEIIVVFGKFDFFEIRVFDKMFGKQFIAGVKNGNFARPDNIIRGDEQIMVYVMNEYHCLIIRKNKFHIADRQK